MAGTLTFKVNEVRRLVEHSKAAKKHTPSYEDLFNSAYHRGGKVVEKNGWPDRDNIDIDKIPAGLLLVKDQGVYLLSNGSPALLVDPSATRQVVAYAKEADPTSGAEFDDWWEAGQRIMGGDDCAETLPLTMFEPVLALLADDDSMKIKVTAHQIQVLLPRKKKGA